MASIESQIEALQIGKSKKIRGISVKREDDYIFIIDDNEYNLADAVVVVQESGTSRKKFQYGSTAFLLIMPFSDRVLSTHQIRDRREHVKLLELAQKKKCYVHYAGVNKDENGKFYTSGKPWPIDWESVENLHGPIDSSDKSESTVGLSCPFCGKRVSSTPGRTLHVKNKHPDRYDEYLSQR